MYGFDWSAKQARQVEQTSALGEWSALRTLTLGLAEHLRSVRIEYVESDDA
jgi:hypothetical protein